MVLVAHCPASGVKVYVVLCVLFNAGDQVPVIPLLDVVGNADKVVPGAIGAMAEKVGVVGLTVITAVPELPVPTFDAASVTDAIEYVVLAVGLTGITIPET